MLRGNLSNIAGLLAPVEQPTQALSQDINRSKTSLNETADTTLTF